MRELYSITGKHCTTSRDFIVISYFTLDTGYEKEVENLLESLKRFNLPYYIKGIHTLGNWQKNTQYKASFIQECLGKFDRPIVFLDADAVVQKDPVLFDNLDCDIAVHYRHDKILLSGTIYMKPTENTKHIVLKWIFKNQEFPRKLEQDCLQRVLVQEQDINVFKLPPEYTKIFDLMKDEGGEAIISHYQASRRFRSLVSK